MREKQRMAELARTFREAADVLDEIVENTDKEREDELLGKFMVKMLKIQEMQ